MIIQEIYWDETRILTIIHLKMDKNIENRTIRETTTISNHDVLFKEYYADKFPIDDFEYDFKIKGFLEHNNEKNPYSNYCVYYEEFVNQNYNSIINDFETNSDIEIFKKLNEFIVDLLPY